MSKSSKSPNARTASRLAALFPADPAPERHAAATALAPPGAADAAYGPPGSEDAAVRHAPASAGIPPPGVPPPDPWAEVPRGGGVAERTEAASETGRRASGPSLTEAFGSEPFGSEPFGSEPFGSELARSEPVQPEAAVPRPLPATTRLAAGVADRIPPGLKAFRIAVDARVVAAVAALALVAIVVAGVGWWRSRPESVAVPTVAASGTARPSDQLALSTSSTSSTSSGTAALPDPASPAMAAPAPAPAPVSVAVHVVGRVAHPGLFALPSGSRVDDALKAAGGALPGTDLAALNLARVLSDGEQVPVGVPGATAVPAPAGGALVPSAAGQGAAKGAGTGVVDLNTATAEQLEGLPGIGPVMAASILDWRRLHGRFTSVEQLREVRGIGERRFEELRSRVRV